MNITLTPSQRRDVELARELLAASGPEDLTAILETRGHRVGGPDPYPEAYGLAWTVIADLLAIIDGLTGDGAS